MEVEREREQTIVDATQREKLRLRELKEAEEFKKKALAAAEMQQAQLLEVQQQKALERAVAEEEGRRIKARCEAELREDAVALERRKEAARKNNVAGAEANRVLQAMREKEAEKEAEEEREVARWAKLKEQREAARRQREKERHDAKQADRDAIIAHTTKAFAEMKRDEEARLARDINEADNKFMAREEAKKQRQTHILREIKQSLEEERARAEAQREQDKKDKARNKKLFEARVKAAEAMDRAEREERRREEVEYKADLREQTIRKLKATRAEKELEAEAMNHTKALRDLEDSRAMEYMKEVTAVYAVQGKPVLPLVRHIEKEAVIRTTGRSSKYT
jgi:hypothetical protein